MVRHRVKVLSLLSQRGSAAQMGLKNDYLFRHRTTGTKRQADVDGSGFLQILAIFPELPVYAPRTPRVRSSHTFF